MILLVSLAVGLAGALVPPVNVEAYLVGLAALHGGPVLVLAVLATTAGHLVGKVVFYALGRGWLLRGLPAWLSRRHDLDAPLAEAGLVPAPGPGALAVVAAGPHPPAPPPPLRARLGGRLRLSRVEALAGRPWTTGLLCVVSATVGVPPFAVMAVVLGRARMPLPLFLLCAGAGRLVRFAAVAGLAGALLG